MYKAVFLDLDGTLLDDNKKISEENKEAIKQAKEKGVQIFLCSGRQQNLVKDYKNEINASDYIICCNGAEIYDCNSKQELFSANLPEDIVYNLYDYANSRNYLTRIDTRYGRFINNMKYFISKEVEIESDVNKFISENKVLQFTIGTETEELIKLITKHEGDFKETEYEIIKEFSCGLYYCVFIKQGEKFVLVFEKDNISHVEIFNSFEEILCYVIKNKLLSEGESIV